MTKEQIDTLAKGLDELRLRIDDVGDTHALQIMEGVALVVSVISVPLR